MNEKTKATTRKELFGTEGLGEDGDGSMGTTGTSSGGTGAVGDSGQNRGGHVVEGASGEHSGAKGRRSPANKQGIDQGRTSQD